MNPIILPIAELKPALTGLSKIINKHSLPVLTFIKIERSTDGWTALTATDLDHFGAVRLEQPSEGEPIELLVPFDELLKATKACSKTDAISIQGEKTSVTISYPIGGQQVEHQCASLPVEEFPPIPRIEGEPFAVNDQLRRSIHEALECSSTDETRFVLNSAFIDVSDPKCHHVIGTDGRHLYGSNSFNLPLKNSFILPSHKFLGWKEFNNDGEWQLRVATAESTRDSATHFQINSRRWQFIGRQIEGNYPNWRQVIPDIAAFKTSIEIDPQQLDQLATTIQRLPCHDPINLTVGLEIARKKLTLLVKATSEANWTKVEVTHANITGKDVTVFLNRSFLIKALKFGLSRIEISDAMSPLRFSDEQRQIIAMPVRADAAPPPPVPDTEPAQEQNGKGAAEPVNSQADKPTSTAATQGRSATMTTPTNGESATGGNEGHFDAALEEIETLKESLQESLSGLKSLSAKLKLIQREQKANVKEFHNIRQTLRNLQSVTF